MTNAPVQSSLKLNPVRPWPSEDDLAHEDFGVLCPSSVRGEV